MNSDHKSLHEIRREIRNIKENIVIKEPSYSITTNVELTYKVFMNIKNFTIIIKFVVKTKFQI